MDIASIRHVAELAELSLTEEEEERLAEDMRRILAYVKELDAVDTTGVPATSQVAGADTWESDEGWRDDEPKGGLSHDDALSGAPKTDHGGFVVPTFVES